MEIARLFGMYPQKGCIAPGSDADLVIWDPNIERVIDGASMQSNAGYSPYDGWSVTGWPALTLSRGEIVAEHGEIDAQAGRGQLVPRQPFERP